MALLDGFRLIELKEKVEESILTIGAKSLRFNRGTARDLGLPPRIRFLVNDRVLQIAVVPTTEDDEDGVDFTFDEGKREMPIVIKEPAVMDVIKKLAILEKNGQAFQLIVKGTVHLEERTIIYDLTEAREVAVKQRGRRTAGE